MMERSNSFYSFSPALKNDAYVYLMRSEVSAYPSTLIPISILIAIGSHMEKPDCKYLENKVGENRIKSWRSLVGSTFYCFDSTRTKEQVLNSMKWAKVDSINYPYAVDAHISWFSATGDAQPVKKLIDNYATNGRACPCILWAIPAVMAQDTIPEIMQTKKWKNIPGI